MDYERYKKYFLVRSMAPRYVGIALVILGAGLFFIGYFFYMYFLLAIGAVLAVAGAIVGWLPFAGCADNNEITDTIERLSRDAVDDALERTGLRAKLADNLPPIKLTGFAFDRENPYIRRGTDGHWRTSDVCITSLIFTKLGVCAVTNEISLAESRSKENITELHVSDFDDARFELTEANVVYGKEVEKATFSNLVFYKDGERVFSVPAERTSATEIEISDFLRFCNAQRR